MKKLIVRSAVVALLVTGLQVLPAASASLSSAPGVVGASQISGERLDATTGLSAEKKKKKKKFFTVSPGASFNDPYTSPMANRLKMLSAIKHTRKGETIRIMTWSFYDTLITNALIRAYHKGAEVQLFMARSLSKQADAGSNFRRLKSAFNDRSKAFKGTRSWARTCSNSCRGRGGAMHSKWMTISQTGASKLVVMQGSANMNIRAAVDQWNDWHTLVGNKKIYQTFQRVFAQSKKDQPAKAVTVRSGPYEYWFAPRKKDPVMKVLKKVRCNGAEGRTGINGKTQIRIASAVMHGGRGEKIASRLKALHVRGCDIRLLYTLAPPPVRRILSGIPFRHLAFDRNGDGLFDDYLHMKAMAISGHVGKDRTASIVYSGSANWSSFGMISDEQGMTVDGRSKLTRRYIRWIDGIYVKAVTPPAARSVHTAARQRGIDPYANVELEMRR